ncbi:hypothetical protein E4U14_007837 [Claviceps sp. LM454 group G7]|nr:hypothetical protein E4U14_007837 [Claviceps sp. LM454 group G7]
MLTDCKLLTDDEAAALPQVLYYLFDWQANLPRVVMIETEPIAQYNIRQTQELVNSREHLACHAYVDSLGQFKGASFIEKKPKADDKIKCIMQQPAAILARKGLTLRGPNQSCLATQYYGSRLQSFRDTDANRQFDRWDTASESRPVNIGSPRGSVPRQCLRESLRNSMCHPFRKFVEVTNGRHGRG